MTFFVFLWPLIGWNGDVLLQLFHVSLGVSTAVPRVSRADSEFDSVPVLAVTAQRLQELLVLLFCPKPSSLDGSDVRIDVGFLGCLMSGSFKVFAVLLNPFELGLPCFRLPICGLLS